MIDDLDTSKVLLVFRILCKILRSSEKMKMLKIGGEAGKVRQFFEECNTNSNLIRNNRYQK